MDPQQPSIRKPRRSRRKKISKDERETLARELGRLRSLFQEVSDVYIVRVSAMIQRLTDQFEGTDIIESESECSLSIEQYDRIFSSIRRLNVKSQKGRRRDLKRIEELAAEIEEIINQ